MSRIVLRAAMSADVIPVERLGDASQRADRDSSRGVLAFEEVYRRHGKALYNFLCYQLGDIDHAEEVFAIVCERVFLNMNRYDARRAPLVRWLFSIARNAVIDERRNRPVTKALQPSALPEPQSMDPSPEEALLRREKMTRLARIVSGLTGRERDVVSLEFSGGLSNQAIARLLGLKEGHVAVVLHRAVHRLRGRLLREEGL